MKKRQSTAKRVWGFILSIMLMIGGMAMFDPTTAVIEETTAPKTEYFLLVLKNQADTSFAKTIKDRNERVTYVYTTLTRFAISSQAKLRAELDAKDITYHPYYIANAIAVQGDAALRETLSKHADVAGVLDLPYMEVWKESDVAAPNNMLEEMEIVDEAPTESPSWGIDHLQAPKVWSELGVTGQGIIVGSADTGVDWTHPDLRENYLGAGKNNHDYTWFDPWFGKTSPADWQGHGTHTTGTAVGKNGIGVAPGAKWIGCVNLGRSYGNAAYYMECMQFLFAPFAQGSSAFTGNPLIGAHIVNNSWGCPPQEGCDSKILVIGMSNLANAGQMNVVAAGNDGPNCASIGNPSFGESVFSVGALDQKGKITSFSSRGPVLIDGSGRIKPDVIAPGSNIYSAFPGGKYSRSMGTSMAAPHVAGVVALVWSARPDLIGNIDGTRQIVIESAQAITPDASQPCGGASGIPNNYYGHGGVNAYAAVQAARAWGK
jgi:subtilisin family serine protease